MSGLETFVWGVAGSFVAYLAVFVLPELRSLLEQEKSDVGSLRVTVFVAIMLAMIIGGGLLAVAIGDASEPKHAFFYGAGWEGFLKGAGEGSSIRIRRG